MFCRYPNLAAALHIKAANAKRRPKGLQLSDVLPLRNNILYFSSEFPVRNQEMRFTCSHRFL